MASSILVTPQHEHERYERLRASTSVYASIAANKTDPLHSAMISAADPVAVLLGDLCEDLDVLGHRLLDKAALAVAPISDSPKPPPCRVTLTYPAGIFNASADYPAANSWSGRHLS